MSLAEDFFPDDPLDLEPEFEEDAESVNAALRQPVPSSALPEPPGGNRAYRDTDGEERE